MSSLVVVLIVSISLRSALISACMVWVVTGSCCPVVFLFGPVFLALCWFLVAQAFVVGMVAVFLVLALLVQ